MPQLDETIKGLKYDAAGLIPAVIVDADTKAVLMVAYMKRYDAGNLLVKKLVDQFRASGEMGKLRFVRNCFPHKGYLWNYGDFPQVCPDHACN